MRFLVLFHSFNVMGKTLRMQSIDRERDSEESHKVTPI